MAVDLHCHSTASDGTLSPASVVALAAEQGVTTLALTDHDTIDGVAEAVHAGADHGVRVIPGVEISTGTPFGRTMHLIALFADPDPPGLTRALTQNRARRDERIDLILARLAALGPEISRERVDAHATGTVARPHIAAALVEAGHCSSVQDAMDRYLGDHRPADVPHRGLDGAAAVRLVRELGGAPIVAHPGTLRLGNTGLEAYMQSLATVGLVGIEVHRPEHLPGQRDVMRRIARRFGLVASGGSDFHGPESRFRLGDTGEPALPDDAADVVLSAVGKRVPSLE